MDGRQRILSQNFERYNVLFRFPFVTKIIQEAQLMLTHLSDAFIGKS